MNAMVVLDTDLTFLYQRRFTTDELIRATSHCHLYLVTRRKKIRITRFAEDGGRLILRLDLSSPKKGNPDSLLLTLPVQRIERVELSAQGAYFHMTLDDGSVWHGDAWSLASLMTKAIPEVARQEVLYIGQGYGKDGARNYDDRISKGHQTYQRILEKHAGSDYDVFVGPVQVDSTHLHFPVEGSKNLPEFDFVAAGKALASSTGTPTATAVSLVEHGLISHFKPPYNTLLKTWDPTAPTTEMRVMQAAGVSLLDIQMIGWTGITRLFTSAAVSGPRALGLRYHLDPATTFPQPRVYSSEDSIDQADDDWLKFSRDRIRLAEQEPPFPKMFGPEAPDLRIPPDPDCYEETLDNEPDNSDLE